MTVAALAALSVVATGCSSSGSTATSSTTPSTVLDGTKAVTAPFTADDGALLVVAGPPPAGVDQDRATEILHQLAPDFPDHPTTYQVFPGRVTMAEGLGAPALDGVAAWVVVYQRYTVASCPVELDDGSSTTTTTPPRASGLSVLIVAGPSVTDDVTRYQGAGVNFCSTTAAPSALSGSAGIAVLTPPWPVPASAASPPRPGSVRTRCG